jgi:hypothetical protein
MLIWFDAEKQWHQTLDFGVGLWIAFTQYIPAHQHSYYEIVVLLCTTVLFLCLVAASIRGWRILPPEALAFAAVITFMAFAYSNVGPRPRMILAIFPLFILLAPVVLESGRTAKWVLGTTFVLLSVGVGFVTMYAPFHVVA